MSDDAVMFNLASQGQQKNVIERRLNEYRDFLGCAETEYNKQLVRINCEYGGEAEDARVFLNFCEALENQVWEIEVNIFDKEFILEHICVQMI